MRHRGSDLNIFATITTFGTPLEITLDEIVVESSYPADTTTAELLHTWASKRREDGHGRG